MTEVREAGFSKWDTHTPFVVHGLDAAMGIKPTKLPFLVFGAGLTGCAAGIGLQWFTNAYDYPFLISGKPIFSLPANIPVAFEMTILFAAISALDRDARVQPPAAAVAPSSLEPVDEASHRRPVPDQHRGGGP